VKIKYKQSKNASWLEITQHYLCICVVYHSRTPKAMIWFGSSWPTMVATLLDLGARLGRRSGRKHVCVVGRASSTLTRADGSGCNKIMLEAESTIRTWCKQKKINWQTKSIITRVIVRNTVWWFLITLNELWGETGVVEALWNSLSIHIKNVQNWFCMRPRCPF
jgi:hypothetical protein